MITVACDKRPRPAPAVVALGKSSADAADLVLRERANSRRGYGATFDLGQGLHVRPGVVRICLVRHSQSYDNV